MKYIFNTLLLLAIVITINDVQVRFPTAADPSWRPANIVSITHSSEPLRTEMDKGDVGYQTWEALLQESQPSLGKVVIITDVQLPSPSDRVMEMRVRARFDDDSVIGAWSESGMVKIIGKPKKPVKVVE